MSDDSYDENDPNLRREETKRQLEEQTRFDLTKKGYATDVGMHVSGAAGSENTQNPEQKRKEEEKKDHRNRIVRESLKSMQENFDELMERLYKIREDIEQRINKLEEKIAENRNKYIEAAEIMEEADDLLEGGPRSGKKLDKEKAANFIHKVSGKDASGWNESQLIDQINLIVLQQNNIIESLDLDNKTMNDELKVEWSHYKKVNAIIDEYNSSDTKPDEAEMAARIDALEKEYGARASLDARHEIENEEIKKSGYKDFGSGSISSQQKGASFSTDFNF